jgi:hypothetical protein
LAIADCGGIEALIEILQETDKTEVRTVLGYLLVLFEQQFNFSYLFPF